MKAAIYIRVSTDREEQETSLINQRQYFENYIKERGWDIYEFYVDIESGTKKNRKDLKRLILDGKQKKFDIILAKELSRLARNQGLAFELKEVIENYRIDLITMDNAINTLNGNTQMFGLYAWMYEQEAENTSSRIKMAMQTKAKKGYFRGSNAPYGYRVNKGKFIIRDDETPETVKNIFKMYLDGNGFDAIARKLYNAGIKTPSQVLEKRNQSPLWHGSTIRKILENPNYTGDLVQNRSNTISVTNKKRNFNSKDKYIIVENTHEAIISKEMFESVQTLIASRRKKSIDNPEVNSRAHENVHLFSNMIFCEDCGSAFHYKKNRKGYICGRYNKHGKKACSDHHVLEESLKLIIQRDLRKLAKNLQDENRYALVEKIFKKENEKSERELKSVTAKIEAMDKSKNKATEKFIENLITKEAYDLFITSKDRETAELHTREEKLKKVIDTSIDKQALQKIKQSIDEALSFNELTRDIINRFIEKIEVKADGTVKLFYRFSCSDKILKEFGD